MNFNSKIYKKLFIAMIASPIVILAACNAGANNNASPQPSANAAENLKASQDFLAQNKAKAGIVTTKSGLQYQIIESGDKAGKHPTYDSIVRANYEGKLLNGEVFDSSYARGQAAEFPVSQLIPAWTEALQLMRPGDEWMIWVDPNLGYGNMGTPPGCEIAGMQCVIPPNSLLIFRLRLESIVGAGEDIPLADSADGETINAESAEH